MQPPVADFDHTIFSEEQEAADKSLLVRFYTKSVQHKSRSLQEGRPIFREKEYVEIRYAGNRTDAIARPATAQDIARFPRHYEAFKKRVEMPEEGTPLTEWPIISRSQAEELAFYNVKTVEQLANVSDSNGSKFMGFNTLQQKAKNFIANSKEHVEADQLREELKTRDDIIAGLQKQMDELIARQPEQQIELKMEVEPSTLDAESVHEEIEVTALPPTETEPETAKPPTPTSRRRRRPRKKE